MFELPQDTMKRMVAIHGWSGAVLGLLLYVVIFSGAVVVFAHEIGSWSVGGVKSHQPFERPLDTTLRELAAQVDTAYHDEISVFSNSAGHLMAFYHTHAENGGTLDDKGIMLELDPTTHAVISRREGFGSELFGNDPAGALDDFLVDLHVNLTAPEPWGLYLTGLLGLMMLAATISGLIIHRHLIKDLFVAPRRSSAALNARDRHNLAGSWGLPFAFVLAFTGAFLSFAIALGLPTLAMVSFGGDREAMFEVFVSVAPEEDDSAVPLANIDALLAESTRISAAEVTGFVISHFGRADARITISHRMVEGALTGSQQVFEGASGDYLGPKPFIGTSPSAGDTAIGLVFPLHFGTFAGLLSRIIWFCLGLAMCYVTLSGLQLWLQRRQDSTLWRRLARAVPIVGYGLPIAIAAAGFGFFLSLPSVGTLFWTPAAFVIGACLAIGVGLLVDNDMVRARSYACLLALQLFGLPLVRVLNGGTGWPQALATDNIMVVSFDMVLLLFGLVFAGFAAGWKWPVTTAKLTGKAAVS